MLTISAGYSPGAVVAVVPGVGFTPGEVAGLADGFVPGFAVAAALGEGLVPGSNVAAALGDGLVPGSDEADALGDGLVPGSDVADALGDGLFPGSDEADALGDGLSPRSGIGEALRDGLSPGFKEVCGCADAATPGSDEVCGCDGAVFTEPVCTGTGFFLFLTVTRHTSFFLPIFAVIRAVPFFFAETFPLEETAATFLLLLFHFAFFFVPLTLSWTLFPTYKVAFFLLSLSFAFFAADCSGETNIESVNAKQRISAILLLFIRSNPF